MTVTAIAIDSFDRLETILFFTVRPSTVPPTERTVVPHRLGHNKSNRWRRVVLLPALTVMSSMKVPSLPNPLDAVYYHPPSTHSYFYFRAPVSKSFTLHP